MLALQRAASHTHISQVWESTQIDAWDRHDCLHHLWAPKIYPLMSASRTTLAASYQELGSLVG